MLNSSKLQTDHNRYANSNIGGINRNIDTDPNYVKQQLNILENRNQQIPSRFKPNYNTMYNINAGLFGIRQPADYLSKYDNNQSGNDSKSKDDRYDAYGDYLHQSGIKNLDTIPRYKSFFFNVDSRFRNKTTYNVLEKYYQLTSNPIIFTKNSSKIKIYHPNHEYNVSDKISIVGVPNIKKIYQSCVDDQPIYSIGLYGSLNYFYMAFDIPHNIPNNFNTSNLFISIAGFKGHNNTNYIGNIPINQINKLHRVLISIPGEFQTPNRFYIKLDEPLDNSFFTSWYPNPTDISCNNFNFSITYYYYAGIPLNLIRSEYPLSYNNLQGYQIITDVEKDYYYFETNIKSDYRESSTFITFGLEDVCVARVSDVIAGYKQPNHYVLSLERSLQNVIIARMISSEFHDTERTIRIIPEEQINNKLYWQNYDDGDTIYSITVDPGYYSPSEFALLVSNKIKSVNRSTTILGYSNQNYIDLTLDTNTNVATFNSYKIATLKNPIIDICNNSTSSQTSYLLTIHHPNHNLKGDDTITIQNSLDIGEIPSSIINSTHTVYQIIDISSYVIQVTDFNLLDPSSSNITGGNIFTVLVPNKFRLLFNYNDTFGNIIGFRNVGAEYSITDFDVIIKNTDLYYNEVLEPADYAYNSTIYQNNFNFKQNNYIMMQCNQLPNINSFGNIKNIFTKILLNGRNNELAIDTFVNAQAYYHEPLPHVNELEFSFYDSDGYLYDFGNRDHSFTIELITIEEIPFGTNIISNYPKFN